MDFNFQDADGDEVMRCVWALLAEQDPGGVAWWAIGVWDRWRSLGYLPFHGDLGDQPAWLAEALGLIDGESRRRDNDRAVRDRDQLVQIMARGRREER